MSLLASVSPPFTNETNAERAIQDIDRDIREHESHIITLRNRRNGWVPIAKLPPELLCRVFHFASRDDKFLQWIQVSYVCRRWRDVAVNSPSLWTNPPLQFPLWTEECLSRSKMAQLTIVFEFRGRLTTPPDSLSKIFLHHSSRICRLKISLSPESSKLLDLMPKSAPCLESLIMDGNPASMYIQPGQNTIFAIPDVSLCEMGRILCLELTGVAINWKSHLHNTLTKLKLHGIPSSRLPNTTQFWDALKNMPLLETLDLQDALPIIEKATSFNEKIHFRRLQELLISCSMAQVRMFLQGVTFPPTAIVKAACHQEQDTEYSDFNVILSSMAPTIKANGEQLKLDISIPFLSTGSPGLQIEAFNSPGIQLDNWEFYRVPPNPFLSLAVPRRNTGPVWDSVETVLTDVFHELPLDEVTQLRIRDTTNCLSSQTILETLGTLPKLESLVARVKGGYLLALQATLPSSDPSNQFTIDTVSFPSLRSITIFDTQFDLNAPDEHTITPEGLLDCLIWRYEHGAEVQNLKIKSCIRISSHNVCLFREVVVDVEWDGVEEFFTDDEEEHTYESDSEYSPEILYTDEYSSIYY